MAKIFYGNQYIESFKCDGRKYSKFQIFKMRLAHKMKLMLTAGALLSVIGWSVYVGSEFIPKTVYAEKEVVREVELVRVAPVMDRIAKCESGDKHFDPKTGQVYTLGNTNKTVDVGRYMINTVWHKKAAELGFDITKEEDNKKMAYWIYENFGTEPWVYSKHCWNK